MLEQSKVGAAFIGALVSAAGSLLFYAITFGEMRSDVKALRNEISTIKAEMDKRSRRDPAIASGPVTKADVCLRLVEALQEASVDEEGQYRLDTISAQLEKTGCHGLPNPSLTSPAGKP